MDGETRIRIRWEGRGRGRRVRRLRRIALVRRGRRRLLLRWIATVGHLTVRAGIEVDWLRGMGAAVEELRGWLRRGVGETVGRRVSHRRERC